MWRHAYWQEWGNISYYSCTGCAAVQFSFLPTRPLMVRHHLILKSSGKTWPFGKVGKCRRPQRAIDLLGFRYEKHWFKILFLLIVPQNNRSNDTQTQTKNSLILNCQINVTGDCLPTERWTSMLAWCIIIHLTMQHCVRIESPTLNSC